MADNSSVRAAGRLLVTAAVVMALAVAPVPAAAGPSTEEEVYRALGLERASAQYVVLIDTSSSMKGELYQGVKTSLRGFLAALGAADDVTLVTFDNTAAVRYHGPAGNNPDTLIGKLPAAPTGQKTDIGVALEAAVKALEESKNPIATVLLLTDGRHDPPKDSPYPYTEGASWSALANRVAETHKQHLMGYAVPLQGETDAGLLATVVPGAKTMTITSIGALERELAAPKNASRALQAREALGDDGTHGIVVEWPAGALRDLSAGTTRTSLELRSTTRYIPLEITGLTVTSDDPRIRAELETTHVNVAPGQRGSVGLVLRWDAGDRSLAPFDRRNQDATLTVRGRVDSPWAAVLRQPVGATLDPKLGGTTAPVHASAERGQPLVWLLGLIVVGLAVAALTELRRRGRNPRMYGQLRATSPISGQLYGEAQLTGRSMPIAPPDFKVPGRGTVRGAPRPGGVALSIEYGPPEARTPPVPTDCKLNQLVIVNGVAFEWSNEPN